MQVWRTPRPPKNVFPVDLVKFQSFLQGYEIGKLNEVFDIVGNGVQIPSDKIVDSFAPVPVNQKSVLVDEMLMLELKENSIASPFLVSPPGLIVSPLGAVPKKRVVKSGSYTICLIQ